MIRIVIALVASTCLLAASAPASTVLREGGRTPVARPGTDLASERAISRSKLRRRLADAMSDVGGASGAYVFDIDARGDGTLYGNDASERRTPASNENLFTTSAFLAELGPDAHLHTRAYVEGKLTGARDSVLDGDLVIVGDGDPAFGTARFARAHDQPVTRVADLAAGVASAGIRRITGRVLADDSIFDRKRAA